MSETIKYGGAAPADEPPADASPAATERRTPPYFSVAAPVESPAPVESKTAAAASPDAAPAGGEPSLPTPPRESTESVRLALGQVERAMRIAGDWACLIGPQSAGKSIYAQYLGGFEPGESHGWTLRSYVGRVAGGLHIARVRKNTAIPLLSVEPVATAPPRSRFYRPHGTKEIVHFAAEGERSGRSAGKLGIHFFDVPGEWAHRWQDRRPEQRAPMKRLLERTRLFVLFVPFWGLLPRDWLVGNAAAAGSALWSTSLAKLKRPGSWEHDPAKLRDAAVDVHTDVEAWIEALWECAPERFDVLVVLSQFQKEAVESLLDAYRADLGSSIWKKYQELLQTPAEEPDDLRRFLGQDLDLLRLVRRLDAIRDVGLDLMRVADDERRSRNLGAAPALDALARLLPFRGHAEGQALRRQRRRARTVTVFPLNTINLDTTNIPLFDREGGDAWKLGDFRMCEDVVLWIALQLTADRIWTL